MKRYRSLLWLMACLCFFTNTQASSLAPDPPTPSSNGPLCEGDGTSLMLMANPPSTGGPFSYFWSGPNGFNSQDENPVINNPTTINGGLYTVTIQDVTGTASGSVSVTINRTPDQPFITTSSSSNSVCERGSITLIAPTYTGATVVYDWTSPDGNNINSPNFPINGANALDEGDYSVTITVNGCESSSSPNYSLDVILTPAAADDFDSIGVDRTTITLDVLANDDLLGTTDFQLSVSNEPSNGSLTDLGDGNFEYTPNDNFVGMDGFTYMLCSTTCETLCSEANVSIRVTAGKDCTAPKVLTPNGDGVNDAFKVNCLEFYPDAELTVFNRYGDRVYRGQNYKNDWMGTMNGDDLPVGTYYYVLKLNNSTNDVLSGYTMLTR